LSRRLKSLIITVSIYIVIVCVFIFIKIHLTPTPEKIITISLMETGSISESKNAKGKIESNLGVGDYDIPVPYPKSKSISPMQKALPPPALSEKGNVQNKPYSILGEIAKRKLIKFVKPIYPEGNMEQSMVSIKITVNRDGYITRINVIKTGGDAFDNNAIKALQEWRFQPLPPNKEKDEQGIVNIYFILK